MLRNVGLFCLYLQNKQKQMKITFKTETEVLKEVEVSQMTDEIQDNLKKMFDDKPILKYEIVFKDGVFVNQCHRLEEISDKIVSDLIITILN